MADPESARMEGRARVAEVRGALRLYGVTPRVAEVLRSLSRTRGDGGNSFRSVFHHVPVALVGDDATESLVVPVTVADGAGRFAPAVFLVRVPVNDPTALLAAVARGLAPLHVLGEGEELVTLPSTLRRAMETDALHLRVRAPYTMLAYVGADAARHVRAGNLAGDAMFMASDPSLGGRFSRSCVSGLVFTVLPRAAAAQRRIYIHCVDGEVLTGAVPTHVATQRGDALTAALAPYALELEGAVAPEEEVLPQVFVEWGPASSEAVRRLARRTVLPADPALEAAFEVQARFLETLHAALMLNAVGGTDAAWVDVRSAVGAITEVAMGSDVTLEVAVRLYGPVAPATTLGRYALNALTCASPARTAVVEAYLAGVVSRPSGGWVASSEDAVLRMAEAASARLAPAPQPAAMAPTLALHPHQLRSLAFMQDAEDGPPLLERLADARVPGVEGDWLPHARALTIHGGYGAFGVHVPTTLGVRFPRLRRGGILANRAGTGKTLVALALVLARPAAAPAPAPEAAPEAERARATLVLCPTSIVMQWAAEAAKRCPTLVVEALRPGVVVSLARLAREADVVVCGFPMMFTKRFPQLRAVRWHRLVIDEAHLAHNHVAALSEMVVDRVWCLTGTPMGAGATPKELDALMRVTTGVGVSPGITFAPSNTLRSYRVMNLLNAGEVAPLFDLMGRAMVRLHPAEAENPASAIESDAVVLLPLPEAARAAYDRLEAESRADVINVARRTQVALTRPLQRLRDWCAGAPLHARIRVVAPDDAEQDGGGGGAGVPYDAPTHGVGFNDPATDVCTVCLEPLLYARLAMPPCRHWFCLPCISVAISRAARCPMCRKPATPATLRVQPAVEVEPEAQPQPQAQPDPQAQAQEDLPPPPAEVFDAKVAGLVALANADDEKMIVFTRHTELAGRYAAALTAWGVPAVHYTRALHEPERNANKARFVAEPELRAIVLDLDNAEGIDGLQIARRVVFCEPFPVTEGNQRTQAVSRCNRLGQSRPVIVRTLAFANTAEARLAAFVPARDAPLVHRVRHYVGVSAPP